MGDGRFFPVRATLLNSHGEYCSLATSLNLTKDDHIYPYASVLV